MSNFYNKIKLLLKSNQTYPGISFEISTQHLYRQLRYNEKLGK